MGRQITTIKAFKFMSQASIYKELLNNQNNYLRAKVNFKTSQYEYVFRIKLLEFYKGEALTL